MHEHRFLIAHHNLPGPSECEGPRQFPSFADADCIADNVELMAGADPLDADEDGDGIPDGLSPDAYAANPLWAESAEDANLAIVLLSAIPADGSATLVVGGLALPLRNPATYILTLPPGEYVPFRLLSRNAGTVDLAFGDPPAAPLMRGGGNASRDLPVWARDPMGVFKGAAEAGSGALAIPVVHLRDRRRPETETSECVHKRSSHVVWQDMDGNGVADKDDGYLVPGSETAELTAIGSTTGERCCGLDTGPESLTARLASPSSNLRLWDASGALLGTDDSLRTFRIQATAPSPSLDALPRSRRDGSLARGAPRGVGRAARPRHRTQPRGGRKRT